MNRSIRNLVMISSIILILMLVASFITLFMFYLEIGKLNNISPTEHLKGFYAIVGQMGDFFGGIIGTIFSIITAILLGVSIYLQVHQIEASGRDVEYNRMLDFGMKQIEFTYKQLEDLTFTFRVNEGGANNSKKTKSVEEFTDYTTQEYIESTMGIINQEKIKEFLLKIYDSNDTDIRKMLNSVKSSLDLFAERTKSTNLSQIKREEIISVMSTNYKIRFKYFFKGLLINLNTIYPQGTMRPQRTHALISTLNEIDKKINFSTTN